MLSDEEREAVEYWKTHMKILHLNTQLASEHYIKVLLDLIEKQSKEIEELKEDNEHQWEERCKLTFELKNSTSNDKIKAKIEEIENEDKKYKNYLKDGRENFTPEYVWARPVLQSLLEKE